MKKVFKILLVALSISLLSCTSDDSATSTLDCKCGVVVQSTSFNVINGNGGVTVLSTIIVRNNCTELTKTVSGISGTVAKGSQWCN
jgi:thioredoxin-related protein